MHKIENILKAKKYVEDKIKIKPTIGIILGSGLGSLADEITEQVKIPYNKIPHFAMSELIGHDNQLVIGKLRGKNIIAMKGRFHYYEGFSLEQVTFPVRLMKALGVDKLIITNACGAVNANFNPGELMIITDHLNLTGQNPLTGPNDNNLGARFPNTLEIYDKKLQNIVLEIATKEKINIRKGVYAWYTGPSYETPAEIRMIRTLGADAVGMSTVPEAIVAIHGNMKVLGISCITNMACGILEQPLSHDEVIKVASLAKDQFIKIIKYSIVKM